MAKEEKKSFWLLLTFSLFCLVTILGLGISSVEGGDDPGTIDTTVEVGNSAPQVSNVTLDGGTNITLTENTTTSVACTLRVTDNNGYTDVASSSVKIFRLGVGAGCSNNDNNCYEVPSSSEDCSVSATASNYVDFSCSAFIWFHADSTDASSTSYSADNWDCDAVGWDAQGASATATDAATVDMNSQYALIIDGTIDYGTLGLNESSTAKSTRATTTGNEVIDLNILGEDMVTSTYELMVDQQEFSSTTFTHSDGSGTDLSSSTAGTDYDVDLIKPTSPTHSSTTIYWNIEIPATQETGVYAGTNTVSAIGAM